MALRFHGWNRRLLGLGAGLFFCASVGCVSSKEERKLPQNPAPLTRTGFGPGNTTVSTPPTSPAYNNLANNGPGFINQPQVQYNPNQPSQNPASYQPPMMPQMTSMTNGRPSTTQPAPTNGFNTLQNPSTFGQTMTGPNNQQVPINTSVKPDYAMQQTPSGQAAPNLQLVPGALPVQLQQPNMMQIPQQPPMMQVPQLQVQQTTQSPPAYGVPAQQNQQMPGVQPQASQYQPMPAVQPQAPQYPQGHAPTALPPVSQFQPQPAPAVPPQQPQPAQFQQPTQFQQPQAGVVPGLEHQYLPQQAVPQPMMQAPPANAQAMQGIVMPATTAAPTGNPNPTLTTPVGVPPAMPMIPDQSRAAPARLPSAVTNSPGQANPLLNAVTQASAMMPADPNATMGVTAVSVSGNLRPAIDAPLRAPEAPLQAPVTIPFN